MDILLVEDDPVNRLLLERCIRKHGHHVDSVDSAEKALEMLKTKTYPMHFLDIGLPGMSGLDLLRIIRAEDTDPPTYVLVGTGETGEKRMSEILDAGANDYIAKPYEKSILDTRLIVAENSIATMRERSRLEQELTFMAKHDPLTGLLNRRQLDDLLIEASRKKSPTALLQIDLDQFKQINDCYGHPAGDEYLIEVAEMLKKVLPEGSDIIRMGGDEFIALAPKLSVKKAAKLGESIIARIRDIRIEDQDTLGQYGASIGVTSIHSDASPQELLKEVDLACYRAKSLGRSCAQIYVPFDADLFLSSVITDTEKTADGDRLELWFQPVCNLNTGEICFHEALLRFLPAKGKPAVDAAMFMTEINRVEHTANLDRFVISRACSSLAKYPELITSVNVDASSICDMGFAQLIEEELDQRGIDGERLILEITEKNAIPDIPVARSVIEHLADLGVRCALDDIGAGFNSIALMKHLPIQLVKLDGELIRDLSHDRYNRSLIEAMVQLAAGLEFEIVGEKIETEEEWSQARELGVSYGQGHLISMARRVPLKQAELKLPIL